MPGKVAFIGYAQEGKGVTMTTRRDRNATATRSAILEAGREIFSQYPYSAVSGLQVCDRAGVTRGALQHHFGTKLGLFMAVFEDLQRGVYLHVVDSVHQQPEPWQRIRTGIAAYLDSSSQSTYQTIVLKQGPAAIGWERWRRLDAEHYANLTREFAAMLASEKADDRASSMFVAIMRGTLTELSFAIAQSDDPASALQQALTIIDVLLRGFYARPVGTHTAAPRRHQKNFVAKLAELPER